MYSKHDTQSVHALCYVYIRAYIYIYFEKKEKKKIRTKSGETRTERGVEKKGEREREDVSIQTT